jgi:hypothetical protein
MATAAPVVKNLQSAVESIGVELGELRAKLTAQQDRLKHFESMRPDVARRQALGTAKEGEAAKLTDSIAEAEMSITGLKTLIDEGAAEESRLIGELRAAQQEEIYQQSLKRFAALEAEGQKVVGAIAGKILTLLSHDLPAYDVWRATLQKEFLDPATTPSGDLVHGHPADFAGRARALLTYLGEVLFDGDRTRAEAELLRQGRRIRGDVSFTIRNLS